MSTRTTRVLLVSALAVPLARKRLLKRTAPLARAAYPHFDPADADASLFEVRTVDEVTLRGKRYERKGATPVILMAGFAGNGFNYDIAFEDCNMALYLYRAGYDVWVANFRGTGREPFKSDRKDSPHPIEDLAVYDAPALASEVAARTGKKPVLVGHSLGGVICYGFLQGVKYSQGEGGPFLEPDEALSAQRNEQVAAVVSVAGPTCFKWPFASRNYWLLGSPPVRALFKVLRPVVARVGSRVPHVPIETVINGLLKVAPRLGQLVLRLALFNFMNLSNTTPETFVEAILSGGSDVSFTQLYQLIDGMIEQDFTSMSAAGGSGRTPYNFSEGVEMITAPILFVAAENDPVDYRTLYHEGFLKVSSEKKDYKCFIGFGHLDLLLGLEAKDTVFPYVADWISRVAEPLP
jgi:pimeloyl-ACP methyl ester carboxylesterase